VCAERGTSTPRSPRRIWTERAESILDEREQAFENHTDARWEKQIRPDPEPWGDEDESEGDEPEHDRGE
jgi:hypothetical protein